MLGKLFKHEMKAMARLLLPLLAVLAVLTIVDRIVIYLDVFEGTLSLIPGIITFAYVMTIIAVVIVSSVLVIYRFYKNLLTDEGYLMFTLPAKSHQLINSKLIASMIWTVLCIFMIIASILTVASGSYDFNDLQRGMNELWRMLQLELSSNIYLFIIELVLLVIFGTINNILIIYVSIAIGQLFNGHKIIGSFAAYIAINIALQVIVSVGSAVMVVLFRNSFEDIRSLTHILFPVIIAFILLLNAIYYMATNLIFQNKLNLE